MRSARSSTRIDGNIDRPIRRVLEPRRHRKRRRQLAMHLALRRACSDGTPRHQIGGILGRDRVEELASRGQTHVGDVEQQRARLAETFVDLEAPVHVGVVDQPFPAYGRAGLLEVDSHDDV